MEIAGTRRGVSNGPDEKGLLEEYGMQQKGVKNNKYPTVDGIQSRGI
jgi:hypothetical protein